MADSGQFFQILQHPLLIRNLSAELPYLLFRLFLVPLLRQQLSFQALHPVLLGDQLFFVSQDFPLIAYEILLCRPIRHQWRD